MATIVVEENNIQIQIDLKTHDNENWKGVIVYKVQMASIITGLLFLLFSSLSITSESDTEVIVTIKKNELLAFSTKTESWFPINIKMSEKVIGRKTIGNIGIVVTSKRILGFSALTGKWTSEKISMNEELIEIIVEGNVASIKTNQRVVGYSAHTGRWIEAP